LLKQHSLTGITKKTVFMTMYKPGDIVVIPFPFSDLTGTKKRPALVLANITSKQEIICMMLTSIQKGSKYEYSISYWKNAGLLKPTSAKLHRIFTISYHMVYKKIGRLNQDEYITILTKAVDLLKRGITE